MATRERSCTGGDLVNRVPGNGPVRPVSEKKRVYRQSRAAAAGLCLGSAMVERGLLVRGGAVELLADGDGGRGGIL